MRSACLVRIRFILNNFSGIELGVPGPPGPPLATPLRTSIVTVVAWSVRASVCPSVDYDRELCQNG